jgi:Mg2+ and Co2+ transporter CorA
MLVKITGFWNSVKPTVTWINIEGIHEIEIIEKIGQYFGVHPLILEDIRTYAFEL